MIIKLLGLFLMLVSLIIAWHYIIESLHPSYNHKEHIWEMDESKKLKANIIVVSLCLMSFMIGYIIKMF